PTSSRGSRLPSERSRSAPSSPAVPRRARSSISAEVTMLFNGSRYSAVDIVEVTGPDGRVSRTLALRAIAPAASGLEHTVADGERLDNLAAGFYGDATRYWL